MIAFCTWQYHYNWISIQGDMRPSSCNDARLTFYMMLKCIYTLVTSHKSELPECIYTEGHIAFIPGQFALKHMYMLYCTFAMSDCISQMLEFNFGREFFGYPRTQLDPYTSPASGWCCQESPQVYLNTFGFWTCSILYTYKITRSQLLNIICEVLPQRSAFLK